MRIFITKRFNLEAAHHLPGYAGLCEQVHGHSYKLEVTVGAYLVSEDMVMDFSDIKKIIKAHIIDRWDHKNLNTLPEFTSKRPTAENMVIEIVNQLIKHPALAHVIIHRVKLWETEDSYAEWINEIE